jgi:hypothetical protein
VSRPATILVPNGRDKVTRRPVLRAGAVTVRPGRPDEVAVLHAILGEERVREWWGEPDDQSEVAAKLLGDDESVLLVVEVDGEVAGGIEYSEELTPMYRHAGIDIFLSGRSQGRGNRCPAAGRLPAQRARSSPVDHRPGGDQRAGHPLLRESRLPPRRLDAPVRAGSRRHVPRRAADGPAARRAGALTGSGKLRLPLQQAPSP